MEIIEFLQYGAMAATFISMMFLERRMLLMVSSGLFCLSATVWTFLPKFFLHLIHADTTYDENHMMMCRGIGITFYALAIGIWFAAKSKDLRVQHQSITTMCLMHLVLLCHYSMQWNGKNFSKSGLLLYGFFNSGCALMVGVYHLFNMNVVKTRSISRDDSVLNSHLSFEFFFLVAIMFVYLAYPQALAEMVTKPGSKIDAHHINFLRLFGILMLVHTFWVKSSFDFQFESDKQIVFTQALFGIGGWLVFAIHGHFFTAALTKAMTLYSLPLIVPRFVNCVLGYIAAGKDKLG